MRTIKFRGKRTDNGEWVYGYYWKEDNNPCFRNELIEQHYISVQNNHDWYLTSLDDYNVITETVGQFTGLIDQNKEDIYEGDLIKMEEWWYEGDYKCFGFIGKVIFDNGQFAVNGNGDMNYIELDSCSIHNHQFEVIGNIYDNPELLK